MGLDFKPKHADLVAEVRRRSAAHPEWGKVSPAYWSIKHLLSWLSRHGDDTRGKPGCPSPMASRSTATVGHGPPRFKPAFYPRLVHAIVEKRQETLDPDAHWAAVAQAFNDETFRPEPMDPKAVDPGAGYTKFSKDDIAKPRHFNISAATAKRQFMCLRGVLRIATKTFVSCNGDDPWSDDPRSSSFYDHVGPAVAKSTPLTYRSLP